MKKFRPMPLVLAALVLCGGCNVMMGPDKPVTDGNLVITLGDDAGPALAISSGSALPADVKAAMRYDLTLTGPDGEVTARTVSGGGNLRMTAALGAWRIDARAYQQDSPTLAGTGSLSFTVAPGTNSVRVPMYMGSVCYEIHHTMSRGRPSFTAAFPGTTITMVPDPGYVFKTGSGVWDSTPFSGSGFTMPGSDITAVTGDFVSASPVRYVTAGAPATDDGLSWGAASGDLQRMMDELALVAAAGYGPCIVKMGAGTYRPEYKMDSFGATDTATPPNDRDSTFMLRQGVQVWGGYPATGGTDAQRDPAANVTILNGDINSDNTLNGNAYHVVLGVNIDSGTILDGLTISGGSATGTNFSLMIAGVPTSQSCGGGLCLYGSSPVLINLRISGNESGQAGGGIYNNSSSPVLVNTTVFGNQAYSGGGIYNDGSSPVLVNVLIRGNLATNNGGGVENAASYTSPVLINVTIAGNKAANNGGGIYSGSAGQALIRNSIMWGNTAGTSPNAITGVGAQPVVSYSIVQGSSGGAGAGWTHSGAVNGGGNAADPGSSPFTNWANPNSTAPPNNAGDYTLNNISGNPAVDAGSSGLYPAGAGGAVFPAALSAAARAAINAVLGTDLDGGVRKNGVIDMGAYER
ncbi:MAG: right-handed parallel beta-helix repeat-containing protein [Treponema sp.]|jgi:hypothetical protein|nr:right-handed parallel beta-helix repeat-containing protein [Treponema sp.]